MKYRRLTAAPDAAVVSLLILAAFACAPRYAITTEYDREQDWQCTRMSSNVIGGVSTIGYTLIVNGAKVEESGTVRYGLWIRTVGPNYFSPTSLVMQIDGEVVEFGKGQRMKMERVLPKLLDSPYGDDPPTSARRRSDEAICRDSSSGCAEEHYLYDATAQQLWLIANANEVVVRLEGRDGYVERDFSAKNVSGFKDFCSRHVPPAQSTSNRS